MTWASIALRSIGAIGLLPLLLQKLSPEEVSIWYLIAAIASLNSLLDLGFNPSFTRIVAYAYAGKSEPDSTGALSLSTIHGAMRHVYLRLAFGATFLMLIWGTASLLRPVAHLANPQAGWLAWAVAVLVTPMGFLNNLYLAYLQGTGHVAMIRRWDAVFSLLGIVSNLAILKVGGGLFGLVVSTQFWCLAATVRGRLLVKHLFPQVVAFNRVDSASIKTVLRAVWPNTWRFGLGAILYNGALQASGIFFAQVGNPKGVATYLLSSQLLNVLRLTAQAPFYSRIPFLSQLWASGKKAQLVSAAARGMRFSYWAFIIGFLTAGIAASIAVPIIGSKTEFADPLLWALMGVGAFLERYGGMHQNLVATTDRVVSHWAGAGFMILFTITTAVGVSQLGVYVFPVAMIVGHLLFFSWYSGRISYETFGLSFNRFERLVFMPASICMVLAAVGYAVVGRSLL
jgi:hypothetical protein